MRRGSFVGDGVSGLWSASGNGLMGVFRLFKLMVRTGIAWLKGVSGSVLFKTKVMGGSKGPFAI